MQIAIWECNWQYVIAIYPWRLTDAVLSTSPRRQTIRSHGTNVIAALRRTGLMSYATLDVTPVKGSRIALCTFVSPAEVAFSFSFYRTGRFIAQPQTPMLLTKVGVYDRALVTATFR
jgi:hypothetical protein